MDTHPDSNRISELAFHLWEQDGRPTGRDLDYWLRAETLVAAEAIVAEETKPALGTPPSVAADEGVSPAVEAVEEVAAPKKPRKPKTTKPKA